MSRIQQCYCSYCRNERSYVAKKHIGFLDILFLLVPSVLLSFIFWQKLDPRLLVFWAILGGSFEALTMIRWRISIVCQYCGFDPVLYVKSPEEAAQKVKNFMDERKASATYLLSSKQYGRIARRKIKKDVYAQNNSASAET